MPMYIPLRRAPHSPPHHHSHGAARDTGAPHPCISPPAFFGCVDLQTCSYDLRALQWLLLGVKKTKRLSSPRFFTGVMVMSLQGHRSNVNPSIMMRTILRVEWWVCFGTVVCGDACCLQIS